MIDYTSSGDSWVVCQVLSVNGTVLHKAVGYAVINAVIAGLLHWYLRTEATDPLTSMEGVGNIWTGYTSILGFLVVFRNNQAYSRFWEGATLVRQVRGEWFNAVSALIAFSKKKEHISGAAAEKTNNFQEVLVRLASALYCSALRQVCDLDENALQVLDLSEVNPASVQMLADADDRCQLIIFWLQALIIQAERDRVLDVPPPILSRVFQELSRGMVNLTNLHKIKEIPFPYPYQQMLIVMLIIHNIITTCMAAVVVESIVWACGMAFMVTGSFWTVIYIAVEIDQPFGDDPNDLPLIEMQEEFNADLVRLLKTSTAMLPSMNKSAENHQELLQTMESELPSNRPTRRKDTTKLTVAGFDDFKSEDEKDDIDTSEGAPKAPQPMPPQAVVNSKFHETESTANLLASPELLEIELLPTSPLSEEPARFRFARYLREAAEQFEKDTLDAHHEFGRVVSATEPDSPKISNIALQRSATSDHLGTGSRLSTTRAKSKDRGKDNPDFDKLEGSSATLGESFKAAKERLRAQAESVRVSTAGTEETGVQKAGAEKTSERTDSKNRNGVKATLAVAPQGKVAIGAQLPVWPSEQISSHLEI